MGENGERGLNHTGVVGRFSSLGRNALFRRPLIRQAFWPRYARF
jgi:hypothetical protein